MSKFKLDDSIKILDKTPDVLKTLLSNLPESWIKTNEGGDSWSAFDIVGHLVHGEKTDWISRAEIILEHGKAKPFTPFDRFAQFEDAEGKNFDELLDEFRNLRNQNLITLNGLNLQDDDLKREGVHPELGIVTLEQLLATWVVHDLGHIRQITRILAKNYKEEIGAWRQYLPVVNE
ncbi:hypothetical protein BH20ACI4_BH20ACI4_06830 [soil metagenome]